MALKPGLLGHCRPEPAAFLEGGELKALSGAPSHPSCISPERPIYIADDTREKSLAKSGMLGDCFDPPNNGFPRSLGGSPRRMIVIPFRRGGFRYELSSERRSRRAKPAFRRFVCLEAGS